LLCLRLLGPGCQNRDTKKAQHLGLSNFTDRLGLGEDGKRGRGELAAMVLVQFKSLRAAN
jgi:hypothetical protein